MPCLPDVTLPTAYTIGQYSSFPHHSALLALLVEFVTQFWEATLSLCCLFCLSPQYLFSSCPVLSHSCQEHLGLLFLFSFCSDSLSVPISGKLHYVCIVCPLELSISRRVNCQFCSSLSDCLLPSGPLCLFSLSGTVPPGSSCLPSILSATHSKYLINHLISFKSQSVISFCLRTYRFFCYCCSFFLFVL